MTGSFYEFNTTTKKILFDTCIESNVADSNCLAVDSSAKECYYCKKGYTLNLDSKCD